MDAPQKPYILGLDLGVQSVGWAVIDLDDSGGPCGVRRCGVRCFDSGVGNETKIASGKDESQNIKRRQARQQRRQLWRRGRRLKKVFRLLQAAGLLPADESRTPQQRHELLKKLDIGLAKTYLPEHDRVAGHLLPYRLRALALDEALPPFAFGRVLFHLGQRRGFLSNRKSVAKEDKESSDVKAGIAELWGRIQETNARTLGEYFATLDPEEQRIRKRWTARQMYIDELEKIWTAQSGHHLNLTDAHKHRISDAIFRQRPLKSQKSLIGRCDLEPTFPRAPRASLEAQRFRYLQKVNDLEIVTPDGEILPLSPEQRATLIDAFETHAEVTFDRLRTILKLKVPRGSDQKYTFNLEAGGEKKLRGNATAVKLRKVLGDDYAKLSAEQLADIVEDLLDYERKDALVTRLTKRYGIAPAKAAELADVTLEDGYASLSREAMKKLLPLMENGMPLATARKQLYGVYGGRTGLRDFLPPVLDVMELRNPVVCRGLTELRKVVNAQIHEYGKPESVRIELARDLKRSRRQRADLTKQNRENEKSRDAARTTIAERLLCDEDAVRNSDILRVRLAEECNWECPYTGRSIAIGALVSKEPQFDIEHILPFSRSLDDSFANKTLCYHQENRDVKRNQMPYDAYAGDEKRWQEIIARVKRFRGPLAHAKLRKFHQKQLEEDWAARMLNDTRYMSRLATEYLGLLYGGVIDADNRRRVQVSAGRVTAYLRDEWGLNALLGDGDEKSRDDHRHHAVDAMVIALTNTSSVKMLSRSAEVSAERGHRLFALEEIEKPWPTFVEDIGRAISAVNVSYRVNRRVSGALHEETNYSKPHLGKDKDGRQVEYYHVRKPLGDMTAGMIDDIVDDTVRTLVQQKVKDLGGFRKGLFSDEKNHPFMKYGNGQFVKTNDDRLIPIHKARMRVRVSAKPVGKGSAARYVTTKTNHHMEIFAVLDEAGKEIRWEGLIIDLREAMRRVNANPPEPVIQRSHGAGKEFRFSLAKNEYVEMAYRPGERRLYRVVGISEGDIEFHLHTDARPTMVEGRQRVRGGPARLFRAKARKVVVDPLGNILPAND